MVALALHNKLRKIHNVDALKLNKDLSKQAQEQAQRAARKGYLEVFASEEGENLAQICTSSSSEMSAQEAIMHW